MCGLIRMRDTIERERLIQSHGKVCESIFQHHYKKYTSKDDIGVGPTESNIVWKNARHRSRSAQSWMNGDIGDTGDKWRDG